jgi:hypothetical protein
MVWNNNLVCNLSPFEHHVVVEMGEMKRRLHDMAIDLTHITSSVTRSVADTKLIIEKLNAIAAASTDPATQASLEALAGQLDTESAAVEAALAPTGATGPAAPAA